MRKSQMINPTGKRAGLILGLVCMMGLSACGENQGSTDILETDAFAVETTEEVPSDTEAPVIYGVEDYNIIEGEEIDFLENVTADDELDGNIQVEVDLGKYDTNTAGKYTIKYTATDLSGNVAEEECTVTVEPKIIYAKAGNMILGTEAYEMYVGDYFDPYAGVSLSDDFSGDANVTIDTSALDTSKEGVYKVIYQATNTRGQIVQVNRQVTVNHIPVMYTLPGGTASWDVAGVDGQPYMVCVNRAMNTVTVYGKDGNGNYTSPVTAFVCSTAREGYETPLGRFVTSERYDWRLLVDGSYGRYAIRISGKILFHSVPYFTPEAGNIEYEEFNKLGSPASQGCIRLLDKDIYWLYTYCPTGFVTVIYDDTTLAGPLGKPTAPLIDTSDETLRGWDPTDPAKPQ